MSDKGLDDSAILLLSLGEEAAAEVFKHLAPKEVQKLGSRMAKVHNVTRDQVDAVLERFEAEASEQTSLGGDSDAYIKSVLTKALGEDKANFIIDRIIAGGDTSGIEGLKWMDAGTVAELIKNEHPQIIASILVHLERDHASEILLRFVDRLRHDVLLRIATLDGIQPAALKELNEALSKVLSAGDKLKKAPLGGARTAAEILNFAGATSEASAIEAVKEYDEKLAQEIQDEMFVFDNLNGLDDKSMQMVLREVSGESLVIALKGASEELREKIFKNMSQRASEQLRDDLESKGPVRLSEVEGQQKEILKIVRRLSDEGQIALGAKGDDAYV
ncbi:flagellar motor switch protein FliG [Betaproteobacteria bacterium GR16-43]|nr:flagellar motor switch protein FliG [Betaproteobacteria bacterium GR16-43]